MPVGREKIGPAVGVDVNERAAERHVGLSRSRDSRARAGFLKESLAAVQEERVARTSEVRDIDTFVARSVDIRRGNSHRRHPHAVAAQPEARFE